MICIGGKWGQVALEPFGAKEGNEQVTQQEKTHDGGDPNHDYGSLNLVAELYEGGHQAEGGQSEDEHRRDPKRKVHEKLLERSKQGRRTTPKAEFVPIAAVCLISCLYKGFIFLPRISEWFFSRPDCKLHGRPCKLQRASRLFAAVERRALARMKQNSLGLLACQGKKSL